jgi:hypothetical protein
MWQTIGITVVTIGLTAGTASAQMLVQAIGGATRQAETKPVFAGAIGGKAGFVEFDAEVGHFDTITPKRTFAIAQQLSNSTIDADIPAWYGMGSIRFIGKTGGVKPFLSAGAGVARLHPILTSTTSTTTPTIVFGAGNDHDTTNFLVGGGGGLRFDAQRVLVDVGYRYMRIFKKFRSDSDFDNDEVLVNVNMFYVALGWRF